jgi:hypothetical protein
MDTGLYLYMGAMDRGLRVTVRGRKISPVYDLICREEGFGYPS